MILQNVKTIFQGTFLEIMTIFQGTFAYKDNKIKESVYKKRSFLR